MINTIVSYLIKDTIMWITKGEILWGFIYALKIIKISLDNVLK